MRRQRRGIRLLMAGLVVGALGLVAIVPAASAQSEPESGDASSSAATPREIDWSPCEEDPNVQCGTLTLPVDWERPNGPTFELAVARRPATDPDARIGPLLLNPGGPGGSGVDFALSADRFFSKSVLRRFDIIGFDPRGVVRSHPVVCSAEAANRPGYTPFPKNQAQFDRLVAYNQQLGADCRKHTGPLFDHLDSVSIAHDVDAIRRALGDRKINWFGTSYGTLMGQMYAEQYPERIRSMVLDSTMDHSLGTKGFLLTESWTAEDSFEEFVKWCDRDTDCALHGKDVERVWAGLLEQAQNGDLTDEDGNPVRPLDLTAYAVSSFYGPSWEDLADWLSSLRNGEPTQAPRVPSAWNGTAEGGKGQLVEYSIAPFCDDWSLPIEDQREFAELREQSERIAPNTKISTLALMATTRCLGWPTDTSNPQHELDVEDAPTSLVLNSLHDPATGYVWALNATHQMGENARLLTYEGWGHGVYDRSRCTRTTVDRYLLDRELPPRDARCDAVEPERSEAPSAVPSPDLPW
jgi:pimeloyl-ACP methyl ester carboxylesterase